MVDVFECIIAAGDVMRVSIERSQNLDCIFLVRDALYRGLYLRSFCKYYTDVPA